MVPASTSVKLQDPETALAALPGLHAAGLSHLALPPDSNARDHCRGAATREALRARRAPTHPRPSPPAGAPSARTSRQTQTAQGVGRRVGRLLRMRTREPAQARAAVARHGTGASDYVRARRLRLPRGAAPSRRPPPAIARPLRPPSASPLARPPEPNVPVPQFGEPHVHPLRAPVGKRGSSTRGAESRVGRRRTRRRPSPCVGAGRARADAQVGRGGRSGVASRRRTGGEFVRTPGARRLSCAD
ncbi:hypothetical protein B0H10DRAFT_2450964 [Mycena sp. CBHHK59/15]|nr:hypothetical protein B0H10DRAFT_2450964 [Mycena sp. CBHHK59/15]